MPKYEILNETNEIINTILADESFVESAYPNRYRLIEEPEQLEQKPTVMSKWVFRSRFTFDERVAITAVSATNPAIQVMQADQLSADEIDLALEDTQLSIMYLVSVGLLTHERGVEILTP